MQRARMGEGQYAGNSRPRGWDYDTLVSAGMDAGVNIDALSEQAQLQLMDLLESMGVDGPEAGPIVKEFAREHQGENDAFNQNIGRQQLPFDEAEGTGYWDAAHTGDNQGSSFMSQDGQYQAADPIGNGPEYGGGQDAIMAAHGKNRVNGLIEEYLKEKLMAQMVGRR